jgi:hypothetical protein
MFTTVLTTARLWTVSWTIYSIQLIFNVNFNNTLASDPRSFDRCFFLGLLGYFYAFLFFPRLLHFSSISHPSLFCLLKNVLRRAQTVQLMFMQLYWPSCDLCRCVEPAARNVTSFWLVTSVPENYVWSIYMCWQLKSWEEQFITQVWICRGRKQRDHSVGASTSDSLHIYRPYWPHAEGSNFRKISNAICSQSSLQAGRHLNSASNSSEV